MKQLTRKIAISAALAALFAAPACAEDVKAGDLVIRQAWSRATPSGAKVAGGYLTSRTRAPRPTGWSVAAAISQAGSRCTRWRWTTA